MNADKLTEGGVNSLSLRFYLVSLLPSALLTFFVFALWSSGAPDSDPSIEQAIDRVEALTGAQVALLLVAVVLSAVILQPFQVKLVQLLEGYWRPTTMGQLAMDIGIELQRRRMRALEITKRGSDGGGAGAGPQGPNARRTPSPQQVKVAWADTRLRFYPSVTRLLPTRLGNALRAAEDRAGERYGLATVTTWPRIYPSLSDKLLGVLNDRRDQLDTAARLCATFLLAAVIAVGFLARNGGRWALIVPAACLGMAWVCYHAAVVAGQLHGQLHGQLLETAFDLHRFDLLAALHYKPPADRREEYELNRQLSEFLMRANRSTEGKGGSLDEKESLKPDRRYDHPPPAPTMLVVTQAPAEVSPDGAPPPATDQGPGAPSDQEPSGAERDAKWLWDAVFQPKREE